MYKLLIPSLILFIIIGLTLIFSSKAHKSNLPNPIITSNNNTVAPSPTPTPPPQIKLNQPTGYKLLPLKKSNYQTFNNCGPATLSMLLDFYNIQTSQQEIADELRPFQHPKGLGDDKSVTLDELASFAQKHNFITFKRPNGDLDKLKLFLEQDIPVLTVTWLNQQGGFGHYRIIKGYNDQNQTIIEDDSIYGLNQTLSYNDFLKLWQVFNYQYLVIVPAEKQDLVKAILKDDADLETSYKNALTKSQSELKNNPQDIYAYFNQSTNLYYLNDFEKSVESFEKVQSNLPEKMLWYQIEPILAYQETKNYKKALNLIERIFRNGNIAASELYFIKGQIFLDQGQKDLAKQEFQKAIHYNKNYTPAKDKLSTL